VDLVTADRTLIGKVFHAHGPATEMQFSSRYTEIQTALQELYGARLA